MNKQLKFINEKLSWQYEPKEAKTNRGEECTAYYYNSHTGKVSTHNSDYNGQDQLISARGENGEAMCIDVEGGNKNCWGTSLYIAYLSFDKKLRKVSEPTVVGIGADKKEYDKNPDEILFSDFKSLNDDAKSPNVGNIARYSKESGDKEYYNESLDDYLEHYATFLIESKNGTKYVFSKSGTIGIYEVGVDNEIGYGDVESYYTKK